MKALLVAAAILFSHTLLDSPYPKDAVNPAEYSCLYEAIYHEARGEPTEGKIAVANVIQNRVLSSKYPTTYCKVTYHYKQFSYTLNKNRKISNKEIQEIKTIAKDTLRGRSKTVVPADTLWYHSVKVKPIWRKKLVKVKTIGMHVFYKH